VKEEMKLLKNYGIPQKGKMLKLQLLEFGGLFNFLKMEKRLMG